MTAVERVEDGGQLLVLHLDELRGGAGRLARGRRDGRDDVAGVARAVGEHALVLDLAAVEAEVGHVVGRQHDHVRGHRRRVDGQHARVRVRRAHERGVQHAGPLGVDRVALRAGHARVHQATSSTARRTSAAITRRRYCGRAARVATAARSARRSARATSRRLAVAQRPGSPAASRRRRRRRRAGRRRRAPPRRPRTAGPRLERERNLRYVARSGCGRHAHLDQQLVRLDARLVVAEDQLADRDRAVAARRAQHRAGVERGEHRRRVRRVVGVGQHAADRRLVAHARARHQPERARQHRPAVRTDLGARRAGA